MAATEKQTIYLSKQAANIAARFKKHREIAPYGQVSLVNPTEINPWGLAL